MHLNSNSIRNGVAQTGRFQTIGNLGVYHKATDECVVPKFINILIFDHSIVLVPCYITDYNFNESNVNSFDARFMNT